MRDADTAAGALLADGVVVRFGRVVAVDGMTLAVEPGELVALIGPTVPARQPCSTAVSGFVSLTGGRISLGDVRLDRLPAHRRLLGGCGRTFQTGGLFPRLSLRDNVELPRRWNRVHGPPAEELLAAAGIAAPDRCAAEVPPGTALCGGGRADPGPAPAGVGAR